MNCFRHLFIFSFLFLSTTLSAQDQAIPIQAEDADSLGTDYEIVTESEVTFIRPKTDFAGTTNPGSATKIALYEVTFPGAGTYEVYARVRVGANGYDDDSFYIASGFGERAVNVDSLWVRMNNIDFGASAPNEYITTREENTTGFGVFKWFNVSENGEGAAGGTLFVVEEDSLTQTFMIGAREDGLDIDMLAFGKADLFYTVSNLENGEAGVAEIPEEIEYTLTIELGDSLRPATHVASGALYGITETIPANIETHVAPLYPRMYTQPARSGAGFQQPNGEALDVAERLATTSAEVTIRFADINPSWPYNFVGWDDWEEEVTAVINEKKESGLTNIYGYEIWNEYHGTWNAETNGNFYTNLWKPTYDLIRSLDPEAKIIGSSDSYYNRARIQEFLEFCDDNDCIPDIISWHELGGPDNVSANVTNYRNLERELRIDPLEISINEYSSGDHELEGAPGVSASFIAKFERSGVHSANISWWHTGLPGRLGSLLTAENQKGGGWHFYKWYGDMTGYMVNVVPPSESGDGLDGFANLDEDANFASVGFGGDFTGTANIVFQDIPESFGDSVDVMIQYVEWEDRLTPVDSPTLISNATYEVESGSLTLQVEMTDPNYGYRAYMTPKGLMISNETEGHNSPEEFTLNQNYPNPFNPVTNISYQLPVNSRVSLKVYDMLGREVAVLVDGHMSAGKHSARFDASGLSSGVYIYRLTTDQFTQSRQMVLIK